MTLGSWIGVAAVITFIVGAATNLALLLVYERQRRQSSVEPEKSIVFDANVTAPRPFRRIAIAATGALLMFASLATLLYVERRVPPYDTGIAATSLGNGVVVAFRMLQTTSPKDTGSFGVAIIAQVKTDDHGRCVHRSTEFKPTLVSPSFSFAGPMLTRQAYGTAKHPICAYQWEWVVAPTHAGSLRIVAGIREAAAGGTWYAASQPINVEVGHAFGVEVWLTFSATLLAALIAAATTIGTTVIKGSS